MRKWVLWNSPQFRFCLALLVLAAVCIAPTGCGGGGGGGGGGGSANGNANGGATGATGTVTINGRVVSSLVNASDGSAIPIAGAPVKVYDANGTLLNSTSSGPDGKFSVPATNPATFTVGIPTSGADVGKYQGFAKFGGPTYGSDSNGNLCRIPIPSPLTNPMPDVVLQDINSPPPAPGPCP